MTVRELRNMHQTFNAWSDFNEYAKAHDAANGTCYDIANVELAVRGFPRTWLSSFDAQADFACSRIDFKYFYTNGLTFGYDILRMRNMLPGQFGYVNKAINAADINECAKWRQALNRAVDFLADLQVC